MFSTISVIGLGYIGLPTATLFASRKVKVIGVDVSKYVVDTVNEGKIHIVEPELDMLVHAAVHEGYLRATLTPEPAEAFLIAVPTPFKDGYKPDLSYIESAAKAIAPVLVKGNLVVLESTSPVGTTEQLAAWLAEVRPDLSFPQQAGEDADIQVAHCPERVLPGKVVHELVNNNRVIGGMTKRAAAMAASLYKIVVAGECVSTDVRTAEMCKLVENSFRDVSIAFANELSMICDKLSINVHELIALANRHPRVNILQPGCGVGGHCIAVDPWFIVDAAPDNARLIRTAREVNDLKPRWVLDKVEAAIAAAFARGVAAADIRIACLGLAFKADIDDLRESPAVAITHTLARAWPGQVAAVEPNIDTLPPELAALSVRHMSLSRAQEWASILLLLVPHQHFKEICATVRKSNEYIDVTGLWDFRS